MAALMLSVVMALVMVRAASSSDEASFFQDSRKCFSRRSRPSTMPPIIPNAVRAGSATRTASDCPLCSQISRSVELVIG